MQFWCKLAEDGDNTEKCRNYVIERMQDGGIVQLLVLTGVLIIQLCARIRAEIVTSEVVTFSSGCHVYWNRHC